MSKDNDDLDALMAGGRQRADAEQHQEDLRRKRDHVRQLATRREAVALKTYGTWRSLSVCTDLAWWIVLLMIGLVVSRCAWDAPVGAWLVASALALSLCVAHVLFARKRTLALVAKQPFAVAGYPELLHHPSSISHDGYMPLEKVMVTVEFLSKSAPRWTLENALRGAGGDTFKGETPSGLMLEGGCAYDGQARWLARYVPTLCSALRAVHSVYPIARITLKYH